MIEYIAFVALLVALGHLIIALPAYHFVYVIYKNYKKSFAVIENFSREKKIEKALMKRLSQDLIEQEPLLKIISDMFPSLSDYLRDNPYAIPIALSLLKKFGLDKEGLLEKLTANLGKDLNIESEKSKFWGVINRYAKKKEG